MLFLFLNHIKYDTIILVVYVDDIIVTDSNTKLLNHYVELLARKFSLKDLSSLSYFLGVEVIRNKQGILLS